MFYVFFYFGFYYNLFVNELINEFFNLDYVIFWYNKNGSMFIVVVKYDNNFGRDMLSESLWVLYWFLLVLVCVRDYLNILIIVFLKFCVRRYILIYFFDFV